MNAWVVELPGKCRRFVNSQADAREMRQLFMDEYKVQKKAVSIDPAEIPTHKEDLLNYINEAWATIDAAGAE